MRDTSFRPIPRCWCRLAGSRIGVTAEQTRRIEFQSGRLGRNSGPARGAGPVLRTGGASRPVHWAGFVGAMCWSASGWGLPCRSGRGAGLNGGMPAELVPCCIPDDGCIAAGLRLSLYSGCFWVVLAGIDPNRAVGSREAVSAYSRFWVHGRLRLETWDRGARGQRLGTGGSAEGLPPATSCGASSGGKPGRH